MTRATIVVVHNAYQQRGGEDMAVDADVALLESHGHRVVLHQRHNDEIEELGAIGRARVAAGAVWSPHAVRALGEEIERVDADLVHVHNTFPLMSPAIYRAATRRQVPVVQSVVNFRMVCADSTCNRDGQVCRDCIGRRLPLPALRHGCYHGSRVGTAAVAVMQVTHRAAGTWSDHVALFLPVSHYLRRSLISAGAISEKRSMVRYGHVPADPGVRARGSDRGTVVFAGRLSPEKGVEVLVRAAALVPEASVVVAGDGPSRGALEELAVAVGASNVRFVGRLDRSGVNELLTGARCLVLPSTCEDTAPLVIAEAAALGVPAIGSAVGGVAEVIGPEGGVLVPAGDEHALAEAVRDAVREPTAWMDKGLAARRHFESRFTSARAYASLVEAYARVGVTLE